MRIPDMQEMKLIVYRDCARRLLVGYPADRCFDENGDLLPHNTYVDEEKTLTGHRIMVYTKDRHYELSSSRMLFSLRCWQGGWGEKQTEFGYLYLKEQFYCGTKNQAGAHLFEMIENGEIHSYEVAKTVSSGMPTILSEGH